MASYDVWLVLGWDLVIGAEWSCIGVRSLCYNIGYNTAPRCT